MDNKNGPKIIFCLFILLAIVIGGYILMQKSIMESNNSNNNNIAMNNTETNNTIIDIRIDKEKDYIYYDNENLISEELDISFVDIHFNFTGYSNIEKTLNDENITLLETLNKEEEEIKDISYKFYNTYYYDKYISLVINYYSYNNELSVVFNKTMTYVFDKYTGNLLSEDDLIKENKLTKEEINKKLKNSLEDMKLALDTEEVIIDIDATIKNINKYNLYIDKLGNLVSSVVVKTNNIDYNETITLN